MNLIYDNFVEYINIPYLISFILLSYGLRDIFAYFVCKVFPKTDRERTYGVFFIAIVVSIPFGLLWERDLLKLFVSYCVGTSLYELLISVIISAISKAFKGKE